MAIRPQYSREVIGLSTGQGAGWLGGVTRYCEGEDPAWFVHSVQCGA